MASDDLYRRLRAICLRFPEVRETLSWGNPTFKAGTKNFAILDSYRGERCLCFKATLPEQRRLCREKRFFVAPYIGRQGWTCLRLDGRVPWKRAERLVEESYRQVAPPALVEALDRRLRRRVRRDVP